jgi:hypothetical protein
MRRHDLVQHRRPPPQLALPGHKCRKWNFAGCITSETAPPIMARARLFSHDSPNSCWGVAHCSMVSKYFKYFLQPVTILFHQLIQERRGRARPTADFPCSSPASQFLKPRLVFGVPALLVFSLCSPTVWSRSLMCPTAQLTRNTGRSRRSYQLSESSPFEAK